MTCKEKLIKDYPEWDVRDVVEYDCPVEFGYMDDPPYCDGGSSLCDCERCWNREIPGTDEVETEEDKNHGSSSRRS